MDEQSLVIHYLCSLPQAILVDTTDPLLHELQRASQEGFGEMQSMW